MIVVTVLSLLTLSVGLSVSRPRGDAAQDWSRFAALHRQLGEQAVLSGDVLALAVDEAGYQRMRRQGGAWVAEGSRGDWRGPVAVIAPRGRPASVIFGPGGQSSPVHLRFEGAGEAADCVSDGWTAVACARP